MPTPSKQVQNLSTNNFIIVMLLITFLVVGVSALAVKSLYTTIQRDNKVREKKSAADDQLKKDLAAAPLLVEAYNSLGSEKTLLSNALPNTADLPSLLVVMENMSASAGVKLKTVSPVVVTSSEGAAATTGAGTASSSAPAPQPYAFSITFDGTYDSMKKLLDEVETSARPMRVTGIQINGSGSALSGQFDLETYYQDKATLPISKETIK